MKNVLSIIALCLITLAGYAQPAKYSFEEVAYTPNENVKVITLHSTDIELPDGQPKYKIQVHVDIKTKLVKSYSVYVSETGKSGSYCMSTVNHITHLNLGTPNTGGVEAYAFRSNLSKVVLYYLIGANTSDTLKFLIYVPSGTTFATMN